MNTQKSSDTFSKWQIKATAQIVRYCWAKYPNLRHVVSHAKLDPGRRSDPGTNFPWDEFRKAVVDPPATVQPELVAMAPPPNPEEKQGEGCCM